LSVEAFQYVSMNIFFSDLMLIFERCMISIAVCYGR